MAKLSTSKWAKYRILKKAAKLRPNLPQTAWMKKSSFWRMIDKYGEVIIKPTGSYGGKGVIRIKKTDAPGYEAHSGSKKKTFDNQESLNAYIKKNARLNYIVQQRIPLVKIKGRPFDLRVMVQRHSKSPWQITGKLAKVAGKDFIVTNVRRSGGKVVSLEYALKNSVLRSKSASKLCSKIDKVAIMSAKQLSSYYPTVRTMGIDMGLDKKGDVWIIEVNFAPMLELFFKLEDKSMFRKIKSFHKKT